MKNGDPVMVRDDTGRPMTAGTFMHEADDDYAVVLVHGRPLSVPRTDVLLYEPLDDEPRDEWCRKEVPGIVDIINKSLAALFPGMTFRLEVEDGINVNLDGVTLLPCTVQVKSIGRVKEFPGFQLTDWKHYPATYWEPEDVSDIPISEHRNGWDAASALVQYVLSQKVRYWFEAEGMAQHYAEMDRLEKEQT